MGLRSTLSLAGLLSSTGCRPRWWNHHCGDRKAVQPASQPHGKRCNDLKVRKEKGEQSLPPSKVSRCCCCFLFGKTKKKGFFMGETQSLCEQQKAQNGGPGHRTQSAPRTHVAPPGGAMALLRGLANAAGTGGAAVQALLRLLPDAAEAEPTADPVATTLGFHQRAGEAESTPLTSLILAGRIPGRVRTIASLIRKRK